MEELALCEAKTRLSELLVAVEQGEQFVITRHGVAVARPVSAAPSGVRRSKASARRAGVEQAFADVRRLREGVTLDASLRAAIEQGRD